MKKIFEWLKEKYNIREEEVEVAPLPSSLLQQNTGYEGSWYSNLAEGEWYEKYYSLSAGEIVPIPVSEWSHRSADGFEDEVGSKPRLIGEFINESVSALIYVKKNYSECREENFLAVKVYLVDVDKIDIKKLRRRIEDALRKTVSLADLVRIASILKVKF